MTETTEEIKNKYFVFSDESGSWHDPSDVYVRAWIVVHESGHAQLVDAVNYISSDLGSNELRWKTIANNSKYWDFIDKFNFRVFITISCPGDINWEQKYRVTRNFNAQVESFDFGEINSDLVGTLKKKMFDDIRNVLFLNFYEKTHIENAKSGIERVLPKRENLLIYRVDPPQMSRDGWRNILEAISPGVVLEFPQSQKSEGIQFADIIAGCIRSFLISDTHSAQASQFIPKFRSKLIAKNKANPNPNLIFFQEINDSLKAAAGKIWSV